MTAPRKYGSRLDDETLSQLDARADNIADERLGYRPRLRPLHLAILVYVAVGIVPWITLSAMTIDPERYDAVIVIGALLAAIGAYMWQRRRFQRWQDAQRAAFAELRTAAESGAAPA